jgi:tRNA-specific 2-thiouridylase
MMHFTDDKNQADTAQEAPTVVVAMSGGVDSSLAAALLVERGFNCIGVMMRLWSEQRPGVSSANKCCSLDSVDDARQVADKLGMPFYLINVEKRFKEKVVDPFVVGYADGLTPNPCLSCNRHIRFEYLLDYARKLGADYLATGHYARLRSGPHGQVQLLKAKDGAKDQSYVLSVLGQEQLRDVLFPVGDYPKDEVRELAAARGLPTASKHDSMDLCFVADDDYRRFLRDWAPTALQPGPILDRQGKHYGTHDGLPNYTIGQRKGLGISGAAEPMYVVELDSVRNALVVGPLADLGRSAVSVRNVNWTLDEPVGVGTKAQCKIRYRSTPAECTLYPDMDGEVRIKFDSPQRGVAPGQAAVFYDGDLCLGGGIIAP